MGRRSFLRGAIVGVVGAVTGAQMRSAATSAPSPVKAESDHARVSTTPTGNTILLAYFSRAGENYYYGDRIDLEIGNTEVLAGMIGSLVACDVYRIEPVDPYPDDYSETRERNVREQDADARPDMANPLASIGRYDTRWCSSLRRWC